TVHLRQQHIQDNRLELLAARKFQAAVAFLGPDAFVPGFDESLPHRSTNYGIVFDNQQFHQWGLVGDISGIILSDRSVPGRHCDRVRQRRTCLGSLRIATKVSWPRLRLSLTSSRERQ